MSESLRRAIQILEALRTSQRQLSARDIAAQLELSKSTVQRLLHTLEECDMAAQDPRSRKYGLGARTLALGTAYRGGQDLRSVALPHMTALRDLTGETVGLTIRIGSERMYLEQVQSRSELRTSAEVGRPYPLWTGAPGRLLLAALPDHEIADILAHASAEALQVVSPHTEKAFWEAIRQVREQGYAVAFEETIPGINTVAAPIYQEATVTAVLSIGGPSARFTETAIDEVLGELIKAAAAITENGPRAGY